MIPKRAFYYWEGEPMSWLRRQSVETFRALNPDWEVEAVPIPLPHFAPVGGFRDRILRSDYARWMELRDRGGLYFDTDMIFVKPIPEEWLAADLLLSTDSNGRAWSIALVGAKPDHPFMAVLPAACDEIATANPHLQPQAFGTRLLDQMAPWPTDGLYPIPAMTHLTETWDRVDYLWRDIPLRLFPSTLAVHWYGGDRLSEDMEPLFGPHSMPTCQVSKAIELSRKNADALRGLQHS